MSTFPGAVRSGLLGDRDNTGEIWLSSGRVGQLGPKEVDPEGVGALPTQTHCPIHYKQSPSSLPLSGDGELATIQGEGRQLSPPPAHTKPLAHTE